jgi:hypothetical protein
MFTLSQDAAEAVTSMDGQVGKLIWVGDWQRGSGAGVRCRGERGRSFAEVMVSA